MLARRSTGNVYILANYSKFGKDSNFTSCATSDITHIITDSNNHSSDIDSFISKSINVIIVECS